MINKNYKKLETNFIDSKYSWEQYPRPQLKRDSFFSLNGEWDLYKRTKNKTENLGKIVVPFPPESDLSKINDTLNRKEQFIYKKSFSLPQNFNRGKIRLNFGAVDQIAKVFVNDYFVGEHIGGYLPFTFDITQYSYLDKENTICIIVCDDLDKNLPYGKQRKKRGGMWYTPISGIWQTVWIESVPENYITSLKITPNKNTVTIQTFGGNDKKTINVDALPNLNCSFLGDSITLKIEEPIFWSPQNPYLYYFTISDGQDTISSYFALRDIGYATINNNRYITLNSEPIFFNALLDQGYFPDGIYLPSSPQGYVNDILIAKKFGFNTLRKHIKIEPLLFYYYCDLLGILVMQDMVNNGRYNFLTDTVLPTIGVKHKIGFPANKEQKEQFIKESIDTIKLLYNSPCVVYYTIFNEGWGQFEADKVYSILKEEDTSRVYDATSGWFTKTKSDVDSKHVYFKKIKLKANGKDPLILSEFGGYSYKVKENSFNLKKTYGYKKLNSQKEFENELYTLYKEQVIPCVKNGLNGAVLTQISDVEDETNGLLTYDRKIEKISTEKMQEISSMIFNAFREETKNG